MQLRHRVGRKMGYEANVIDTNAMTGQQTWCLLDPDGIVCARGEAYAGSEELVWERYCPAYDTDVNLALKLVPDWTPERVFMLRSDEHGWRASIVDVVLRPDGGAFEAVDDDPAAAICTAWLKWKDNES